SGKNPGERLTRILPRRDSVQFSVGMSQQKPHELFTGGTGGANNCDLNRSCRFHFSKVLDGFRDESRCSVSNFLAGERSIHTNTPSTKAESPAGFNPRGS